MSKAGPPESFESRIEQLQAFKEQHGHLKVTDKLDKSLSRFCVCTRTARRNPEEGKSLSEEKIQALDQLGFDWDPLKDKVTSFEERMLQLSAFKEKNGHIRVTKTDDKSLGDFCNNVRRARREPGSGIAISEERISALDELGFDWGSISSPPEQDIQEEEVGRTYVV
jgi:Holliday junction resolvasome RuvABC DNA-binding subunit